MFRFPFLCLWFLLLPVALSAQSTIASISGRVDDPSKAVIPSASITMTNIDTGVQSTGITNNDGIYVISGLIPGKYRVEAEKQGFKSIVESGLILHVQDNVQINFHMPLGVASDSVSVDASGLQMNTTDASVSTVIDHKFVDSIPMNGRSFQSLILLTPGVVTNNPQSLSSPGYSGEFSVNGQRTEANTYTVDGVNANTNTGVYGQVASGGSLPASTALGTTQGLTSIDALQEVRVSSSSYSAEFGLYPGGQFLFQTRSGTDMIHGSAFDYFRNNALDANDWFNKNAGLPLSAERQNDFGGTLGGPIWIPNVYDGRGKSFFFFSYEGLRLMQPQAAVNLYVPSQSLRQEAPLSLQPVMNAFPIPTGAETTVKCDNITYICPPTDPTGTLVPSGLSPFLRAYSLPSQLDSTSLRLDQQLPHNTKLFYRLAYTPSSRTSRTLAELSSITQLNFSHTLGLTTALSTALANDFRLNYTFSKGQDHTALDTFGGAEPVTLGTLQGLSAQESAAADIDFNFYFTGFPGVYISQAQSTQPQHSWNIVDDVTYLRGRNVIKAGVYYRRTNGRLVTFSPDISFSIYSKQSILDNSIDQAQYAIQERTYPLFTNAAAYIQDELKATDRLNLSFGLRWEVNPAPSTSSGPMPYITQGDLSDPANVAVVTSGAKLWNTGYFNFAPRLGVAYRVHTEPGKELIVRAGGGVFFDTGQSGAETAFEVGAPLEQSVSYSNVAFPLTPEQMSVTVPPYFVVLSFPKNLQLPYTLQWNVSLEQALGKSQALTVSYVGSNGRRLQSQVYAPVAGNPKLDYVYSEQSGTTSSYNALQLKFQRNVTRGLQILASYTWSHSLDFGSQNLDFAQIRGNSDFDLRNNFAAALAYELPVFGSGRFTRGLMEGWGIDGRISSRTAFPIILNGNYNVLPNGQAAYSGLNLVPSTPIYLHVPGIAGGRQINPAAFGLPQPGEYGNAPRNFVRGFGANQIDFALHRAFPLHDRLNLQFRAEAFNVLNHANFGYIDPYYGDPQFGQATKMLNQSLGILNPLYQQGGPRSLQLALKLAF